MKTLVLASLLVLALGKNLPYDNSQISQIASRYGYSVEGYPVTTSDGYILQVYRISSGPQDSSENSDSSQEAQKPAVLLLHGFMSSGEDFVYGGPSQGLALYLADQGYDVYIGNSRGSPYGKNHTTLNPAKDAAFWRFSFNEVGTRDLPAIIDRVRDVSGQPKIKFVGHREGATAFYVLASEVPDYQNKIENAIALGPVVYLKSSTNAVLSIVKQHLSSKSWIIKNLGMNTFNPSQELLENLQNECNNVNGQNQNQICQNNYFLFNGFNSNSYNESTIKQVLQRVPSGGSVLQILHFAQIWQSGRFESYNNEQENAHQYDLSQVRVPVAVLYANQDSLAQPSDVEKLINELPNIYSNQLLSNFNNNLEFVYKNNLQQLNQNVAQVLRKVPQQNKV